MSSYPKNIMYLSALSYCAVFPCPEDLFKDSIHPNSNETQFIASIGSTIILERRNKEKVVAVKCQYLMRLMQKCQTHK